MEGIWLSLRNNDKQCDCVCKKFKKNVSYIERWVELAPENWLAREKHPWVHIPAPVFLNFTSGTWGRNNLILGIEESVGLFL